jgi:hypothetical protein
VGRQPHRAAIFPTLIVATNPGEFQPINCHEVPLIQCFDLLLCPRRVVLLMPCAGPRRQGVGCREGSGVQGGYQSLSSLSPNTASRSVLCLQFRGSSASDRIGLECCSG